MTAVLDDFDLDIRIGDGPTATAGPDRITEPSCITECSCGISCDSTEDSCTTGSCHRTFCC